MVLGADVDDIEEDVQENEVVVQETEETDSGRPKKEVNDEENQEKETKKSFDPASVIVLTEENRKNYSLRNLVIPLVGRDLP